MYIVCALQHLYIFTIVEVPGTIDYVFNDGTVVFRTTISGAQCIVGYNSYMYIVFALYTYVPFIIVEVLGSIDYVYNDGTIEFRTSIR